MKKGTSVLGLGLMLAAMQASAGVYLGGSAAFADYDYSDIDRSTGMQLHFGYRAETLPLMIELSYLDTGEADIDVLPGATAGTKLSFSGFQASLGYFAQLSNLGSGFWLKGGFYSGDSEAKVPVGSIPGSPTLGGTLEESSSGGLLGIGGVWKATSWFGIRAEYSTLFGMKDFANDEDLGLLSVGVVFEFPVQKAAAAPLASRPTYSAPYQPAANPAAPAPAISGSAQSHAAVSAGEVRLAQETVLRGQPTLSGVIRKTIPAGAVVQLQSRQDNADGSWWFVEYENAIGWISQTSLSQ